MAVFLTPDSVSTLGGVQVKEYLLTKHNPNGIDMPQTSLFYRVRKTWEDASSQTGAYTVLKNAVNGCAVDYHVYDSNGTLIYTNTGKEPSTDCPYNVPVVVVKRGMYGNDVRWVQWQLTERGYSVGASGIDGDFGANTERGLKAFQEVEGLEVDGICGPITRKALGGDTPQPTPTGFKPRLTRPEKGNKFYIRRESGGYATAIKGNPTDPWCDVLSNCVGYAHSRFHEIANNPNMNLFDPVNAENIYQNAINHGLEVGQEPRLGALIVWQKGATLSGSDGAGHVAVVEQINADGSIVTSESGYGCATPFWTSVRRYPWPDGTGYKFLGFVFNPAVK